jgi:hypothetical protein
MRNRFTWIAFAVVIVIGALSLRTPQKNILTDTNASARLEESEPAPAEPLPPEPVRPTQETKREFVRTAVGIPLTEGQKMMTKGEIDGALFLFLGGCEAAQPDSL